MASAFTPGRKRENARVLASGVNWITSAASKLFPGTKSLTCYNYCVLAARKPQREGERVREPEMRIAFSGVSSTTWITSAQAPCNIPKLRNAWGSWRNFIYRCSRALFPYWTTFWIELLAHFSSARMPRFYRLRHVDLYDTKLIHRAMSQTLVHEILKYGYMTKTIGNRQGR